MKKEIKAFEEATDNLILKFIEKQELIFDGYVSNDCTDIALFDWSSYCFSISDIYNDLKNDRPKGLIIEWFEYIMENSEQENTINYNSYCSGCRYEILSDKNQ